MEGSQKLVLPLLVVEGNGPNLLGKNWLINGICLDWSNLLHVSSYLGDTNNQLNRVLQKHQKVFEELGQVTGYLADIHEEATPRFHKARIVLYALRGKVAAGPQQITGKGNH